MYIYICITVHRATEIVWQAVIKVPWLTADRGAPVSNLVLGNGADLLIWRHVDASEQTVKTIKWVNLAALQCKARMQFKITRRQLWRFGSSSVKTTEISIGQNNLLMDHVYMTIDQCELSGPGVRCSATARKPFHSVALEFRPLLYFSVSRDIAPS